MTTAAASARLNQARIDRGRLASLALRLTRENHLSRPLPNYSQAQLVAFRQDAILAWGDLVEHARLVHEAETDWIGVAARGVLALVQAILAEAAGETSSLDHATAAAVTRFLNACSKPTAPPDAHTSKVPVHPGRETLMESVAWTTVRASGPQPAEGSEPRRSSSALARLHALKESGWSVGP